MSRKAVSFHIVDVFASEPLSGNPLALVPAADALDDAQMRAIAREFNQSETTFLVEPTLPHAHRQLRSFTAAGVEVLGAGHNAMGAWLWLAASGELPRSHTRFHQQIGHQVLPVEITWGAPGENVVVTMDQSPPEFGRTVHDRATLAHALGLSPDDLVAGEPAQVVSTGVGHLLVPVQDPSTVDRANPDPHRLQGVLREAGGEGCYVYANLDRHASEPAAYARFFNPTVGIVEDPATGTAAGPLMAQLVRSGHVADGVPAIIEQGTALGRPSSLEVTVTGAAVRLSGTGVVTASGVLHLTV